MPETTLSEKPILYSPLMAAAVLAKKKTNTRRIIEPQPSGVHDCHWAPSGYAHEGIGGACTCREIKCPYGSIEDFLWGRETHYQYGQWERNGLSPEGKQKWTFCMDESVDIRYYEDKPAPSEFLRGHGGTGWITRPGIFMQRRHSRILQKILGLKVERLQEISEEDAIAEGVESYNDDGVTYYGEFYKGFACPIMAFRQLWESINGSDSWMHNPFVWAVKAELVEVKNHA